MRDITPQILRLLRQASGYLSGEAICADVGVTRAAVWKHVQALRDAGYTIDSAPRKGYRFVSGPDRLLPAEIQPGLSTRRFGAVISYDEVLGSTNRRASELAKQGAVEGTLVVADHQTEGRGRLQRIWFSPPGMNLYASLILRPAVPPVRAPELSLVAAVAIVRAIQGQCPDLDLKIKWPNDVFAGGKKCCGVLCDMDSEIDRVHYLIVGIGINVNTPSAAFPPAIADRATSLAAETGGNWSRPKTMTALLNAFEPAYDQWLEDGLAPFVPELDRFSLLQGRTVTISTGRGHMSGTVTGISPQGALLLRDASGTPQTILSGDVHVESIGN